MLIECKFLVGILIYRNRKRLMTKACIQQ